jgi:perosamine synthetase
VDKLAIHGGKKTIDRDFDRYNSIGSNELNAAKEVIESGVLSKFLGCKSDDFLGGPKVLEFEDKCKKYFNVKHAITVNSWTSGLIAAVGAIGIEPGDEVIVPPWTMCASATAIVHWNAIPVFVDIEPETFCLDVVEVEKNITPHTKAIMAVDIFGHSANIIALMEVARKYNLKVISDTAQAPGAMYKDKYAGTLADIGGYSLNYHKHIHTGEGGILVTNNDEFAERMRLIRNHAEAVVTPDYAFNTPNMIGYNFRLGEIECAMGVEQLKKLRVLVKSRQYIAEKLTTGLNDLLGLKTPVIRKNYTHVFYTYPMVIDVDKLGVSRQKIYDALISEGVQGLAQGYTNLHLLPMYQQKAAYGLNGFPWSSDICRRDVDYKLGICPVAEELHRKSYLGYEMCLHKLDDNDVDLVISAFRKVWDNIFSLK